MIRQSVAINRKFLVNQGNWFLLVNDSIGASQEFIRGFLTQDLGLVNRTFASVPENFPPRLELQVVENPPDTFPLNHETSLNLGRNPADDDQGSREHANDAAVLSPNHNLANSYVGPFLHLQL